MHEDRRMKQGPQDLPTIPSREEPQPRGREPGLLRLREITGRQDAGLPRQACHESKSEYVIYLSLF